MPAHGSLFTLRRHTDSPQVTRRHHMLCSSPVRDRTYCVYPASHGHRRRLALHGAPLRASQAPQDGRVLRERPVGVGLHGREGSGVDDLETQLLPLGRDDESEPTGARAVTLPPQQETLTRLRPPDAAADEDLWWDVVDDASARSAVGEVVDLMSSSGWQALDSMFSRETIAGRVRQGELGKLSEGQSDYLADKVDALLLMDSGPPPERWRTWPGIGSGSCSQERPQPRLCRLGRHFGLLLSPGCSLSRLRC